MNPFALVAFFILIGSAIAIVPVFIFSAEEAAALTARNLFAPMDRFAQVNLQYYIEAAQAQYFYLFDDAVKTCSERAQDKSLTKECHNSVATIENMFCHDDVTWSIQLFSSDNLKTADISSLPYAYSYLIQSPSIYGNFTRHLMSMGAVSFVESQGDTIYAKIEFSVEQKSRHGAIDKTTPGITVTFEHFNVLYRVTPNKTTSPVLCITKFESKLNAAIRIEGGMFL